MKEGKKNLSSSASGLTLAEYLEGFPPDGQEVLRQTVAEIATTRKFGKVANSVLNALASKLHRSPNPSVLSACRIYLARNYAREGKREQYLLGIVRGEAKRQSQGGNGRDPLSPIGGQQGEPPHPMAPGPKTPGQLAIERAAREQALGQGAPR